MEIFLSLSICSETFFNDSGCTVSEHTLRGVGAALPCTFLLPRSERGSSKRKIVAVLEQILYGKSRSTFEGLRCSLKLIGDHPSYLFSGKLGYTHILIQTLKNCMHI